MNGWLMIAAGIVFNIALVALAGRVPGVVDA